MSENSSVGTCPACQASVIEMPKSFSCSAYKETGCKFTLWKNELARLDKGEITKSEAVALLAGQEIPLENLRSSKGGTFSTKGKLAHRAEYNKWGIEFIFGKG